MNDMIKGTHLQDAVKEFQGNRKLNVGDTCGTVGRHWWRGFMRRHEDVIVSHRGEKFDLIRGQWTKKSNIPLAYHCIYNEMVDSGIATVNACPVFTDSEGNKVE